MANTPDFKTLDKISDDEIAKMMLRRFINGPITPLKERRLLTAEFSKRFSKMFTISQSQKKEQLPMGCEREDEGTEQIPW